MANPTDIQFKGLELLSKALARTQSFARRKPQFHAQLSVAWRAAATAFVKAAMQTIKVQTGMSAASYLALARAIQANGGTQRAEQAINAAIAQRGHPPFNVRGIPTFPVGQRRPGTQGVRAGREIGNKAHTFLTGSPSQFGFRFNFQTVVYQHAFHEDSAQTMNNGFLAFREEILSRLPGIGRTVLADWYAGRSTVRRTISSTPTRIRFV